VGRASRFFDTRAVPTHDLISTWHETGLSVIGAALLKRMHREELEQWNAVPRRVKQCELEKLVGHLATTEEGLDQLMILLRHGFLEDGRKRMIKALVTVDPRPKFLFETVLEREKIEPRLLVPVLRLELDRFARWKGLGPALHQALRFGLREHKGPIERFFSQLRRGEEPVENEVEMSSDRRSPSDESPPLGEQG
jgi:hypothetical protein